MSPLSFDPVAHIYDQTRGYPEQVDQRIALSIDSVAQATPETTFLELGVGTGRITLPLATLGRTCSGVDISSHMLTRLQEKARVQGWQERSESWGSLPDENSATTPPLWRFTHAEPHASLRFIEGDITALPFHDSSFDIVIAVHVFHLIDDWQLAVDEALRVLRPGGMLLHCRDEHEKGGVQLIRDQWHSIVSDLGVPMPHTGSASAFSINDVLAERGYQTQTITATAWEWMITPSQMFDGLIQRIWSSTWRIPDDIFDISIERLRPWMDEHFGSSMDTEQKRSSHFIITKIQL